jgi:hypothetical protein
VGSDRIDWTELATAEEFVDVWHLLDAWYVKEKRSLSKIANRLGVSVGALRAKLKLEGFELGARGGPRFTGPKKKHPLDLISADLLFKVSTGALCERFKVSSAMVFYYRRKRQNEAPTR